MCSLHGSNFYLYVYHFYREPTSKELLQEIAFWLKQTGHSKIQILIFTTSGISDSKLNHIIPCLIIMWKFSGCLFISLLTLILSHNLIVTILGNSILLLLKVTVTPFQSISSVSHKWFLFNFISPDFSAPLILNKCILPAVLHNLLAYSFGCLK